MVIVYPLGIPAIFFFLLWRIKDRIVMARPLTAATETAERFEQNVYITYGFLFEAYHARFWFFEVIDMIHKLLLTSVLPFIPQDAQIQFALCVVCFYLMTILWLGPYIRRIDDQLHQLVQVELICLLVHAFLEEIVYLDGQQNNAVDTLISILLISITLLLFLFFLYKSIQAIRDIVWFYRRKQVESVEARMDWSHGSHGSRAESQRESQLDKEISMGPITQIDDTTSVEHQPSLSAIRATIQSPNGQNEPRSERHGSTDDDAYTL